MDETRREPTELTEKSLERNVEKEVEVSNRQLAWYVSLNRIKLNMYSVLVIFSEFFPVLSVIIEFVQSTLDDSQ